MLPSFCHLCKKLCAVRVVLTFGKILPIISKMCKWEKNVAQTHHHSNQRNVKLNRESTCRAIIQSHKTKLTNRDESYNHDAKNSMAFVISGTFIRFEKSTKRKKKTQNLWKMNGKSYHFLEYILCVVKLRVWSGLVGIIQVIKLVFLEWFYAISQQKGMNDPFTYRLVWLSGIIYSWFSMRLHRNVSGIINYNDGQILYAHIFIRFFPLDFQCDMIDDFRKVMIEKQTSHHDMRIVWLREKKKRIRIMMMNIYWDSIYSVRSFFNGIHLLFRNTWNSNLDGSVRWHKKTYQYHHHRKRHTLRMIRTNTTNNENIHAKARKFK